MECWADDVRLKKTELKFEDAEDDEEPMLMEKCWIEYYSAGMEKCSLKKTILIEDHSHGLDGCFGKSDLEVLVKTMDEPRWDICEEVVNVEKGKAISFMFDSMLEEDHSSRVRNVLFKEENNKDYLIGEVAIKDFSIAKMETNFLLVEAMLETPLCGKALDDEDCLVEAAFDVCLCVEAPRRALAMKKENVVFEATTTVKSVNLQQYGFLRSTMKPTPYFKKESDEFLLSCLFIDSLIYVSRSFKLMDSFKTVMMCEFVENGECLKESSLKVCSCEQILKVFLCKKFICEKALVEWLLEQFWELEDLRWEECKDHSLVAVFFVVDSHHMALFCVVDSHILAEFYVRVVNSHSLAVNCVEDSHFLAVHCMLKSNFLLAEAYLLVAMVGESFHGYHGLYNLCTSL